MNQIYGNVWYSFENKGVEEFSLLPKLNVFIEFL